MMGFPFMANVIRGPTRTAPRAPVMCLATALAVLLLLSLSSAGATPRCAGCGQSIEGPVVEVGGDRFHPDCFRCALCGEAIGGRYAEKDGKYYHPECVIELLPRCEICGEVLTGEHVRVGGRLYHQSCYEERIALRCDLCGEILEEEYYTREGRRFCSRCYVSEVADRCVACGEPITDRNYPINFWGEAWHHRCARDLGECSVCSRALGGKLTSGGRWLADGREICDRCRENGITDEREARLLLEEAAREMVPLGVYVDPEDVRFSLCGKEELQELSGRWQTAGYTAIKSKFLNDRLAEEKITIYILSHLGPERFACVAAHELTHVYVHRRIEQPLPSAVEEGLCNYVGSLLLKRREGDMARFYLHAMDQDPDPDYGAGYRRVRRYMEDRSLAELLRLLERGDSLPEGL